MERRVIYYLGILICLILLVTIFNSLAPCYKLLFSDSVGKVWRAYWLTHSSRVPTN